ncbi:hypothetical protein COL5a_009663 [Colletotrichum fioriniae]|nr:uncharacterized protein COL516b_009530 [Colletotrichum fioriniae]KAJ0298975.1 hypothetical protein COL516b_009530 [Colletotrichum fioriniae]KAJ0320546.1 hypothetical protein COL5a_009663 [Colletotrichum fioriniae]
MLQNIPFIALVLAITASAAPLDDTNHLNNAASGLKRRQVIPPPCIPYIRTLKHGDGNPKKKFLHKQVTVSKNESFRNFQLLINVSDHAQMHRRPMRHRKRGQRDLHKNEWSASIADPRGFFSAGFAVSQAITTGQTQVCNNSDDTENQSLCVSWSIAHTEYEVPGLGDIGLRQFKAEKRMCTASRRRTRTWERILRIV